MTERIDSRREPLDILHVEDDPAHAELVRRGFENHRIANVIHHVSTGEQALDYLTRQGEYASPAKSPRPDVVLLDLRLPGIDGLSVLKEIRSNRDLEDLPVVILTTSEAERDKLRSYELHIDSYIVKPFDFDSFAVLLDVIYLVLPERNAT